MYQQQTFAKIHMLPMSNYLGNHEFTDIKELLVALTCKCPLSHSKGGCDSVIWTNFTMDIFIIYMSVSFFFFPNSFVVEHFCRLFYITRFGKMIGTFIQRMEHIIIWRRANEMSQLQHRECIFGPSWNYYLKCWESV